MKIRKITAIYFSPVGKTEFVARTLSEQLRDVVGCELMLDDITLPHSREHIREFGPEDLVVFAMPVFAGRIPNKMLDFVRRGFKGLRTKVIPVVTYGNRNFDNGLKELTFELDQNGFLCIGAAAVVVEHSFSDKLAGDRPDIKDVAQIRQFASAVAEKFADYTVENVDCKAEDICPMDRQNIYMDIDSIPGQWPLEKYYVPLGEDGKPAVFLKAKPKTADACVSCGVCAKACPMGSIDAEDVKNVAGICIKCQACVKKCPQRAKYFDDDAFLSHVKMLEKNYQREAESLFLV